MRLLTILILLVLSVNAQYLKVDDGSTEYIDLTTISKITFSDFGKNMVAGTNTFRISNIVDIGFGDKPLTTETQTETASEIAQGVLSAEPNPFNPELRIQIKTGHVTPVSVSIYDVRGTVVERIPTQNTSDFEYVWNAMEHPSGTYLIRAQFGNHTLTKKVILLK